MLDNEYYDDEECPRMLCERSEAQVRQYTLCLAHGIFLGSAPTHKVYPEAAPAKCFTLAEEFVAEAIRRGY